MPYRKQRRHRTPPVPPAGRTFWTARQIRPTDLEPADVAMIEGRWRPVMYTLTDIGQCQAIGIDPDRFADQNGRLLSDVLNCADTEEYMIICYADAYRAAGKDALTVVYPHNSIHLLDLITIQVPE